MENIVPLLVLGMIGSLLGLVGGVLVLVKSSWSRALSIYSIPFAAGVLITVSFLDLIPESIHIAGEKAYAYVFAAFISSFVLEQFFRHFHHHDHDQPEKYEQRGIVGLIVIGDTIHNFIDGITIAASYFIDPALGLIVALSTFLHEVPHEIADFGIMLHSKFERHTILLINLFSSVATFAGILVVAVFFQQANIILGYLLAIAAGILLYLGSVELLPRTIQIGSSRKYAFVALALGVLTMLAIIWFVPHSD